MEKMWEDEDSGTIVSFKFTRTKYNITEKRAEENTKRNRQEILRITAANKKHSESDEAKEKKKKKSMTPQDKKNLKIITEAISCLGWDAFEDGFSMTYQTDKGELWLSAVEYESYQIEGEGEAEPYCFSASKEEIVKKLEVFFRNADIEIVSARIYGHEIK